MRKYTQKYGKLPKDSNQCLNMIFNFPRIKYEMQLAWIQYILMLNAFMLGVLCFCCWKFPKWFMLKKISQMHLVINYNVLRIFAGFSRYLFRFARAISKILKQHAQIFLKHLELFSWALNILFRFFIFQCISRFFYRNFRRLETFLWF